MGRGPFYLKVSLALKRDSNRLTMAEESSYDSTQPLWKESDRKSNKTGPHHTVYWVQRNQKMEDPADSGDWGSVWDACYDVGRTIDRISTDNALSLPKQYDDMFENL